MIIKGYDTVVWWYIRKQIQVAVMPLRCKLHNMRIKLRGMSAMSLTKNCRRKSSCLCLSLTDGLKKEVYAQSWQGSPWEISQSFTFDIFYECRSVYFLIVTCSIQCLLSSVTQATWDTTLIPISWSKENRNRFAWVRLFTESTERNFSTHSPYVTGFCVKTSRLYHFMTGNLPKISFLQFHHAT